ncbi:oxygenase MpaB family protein [Almyronema epifaneia]|uniref:Oxygenase MpaB family protein n=1 Tax=Almyronema epifaneia S1 TaxID=2991925 RepID=A0ABW6IHR5_9CYAN
MQRYQYLHQIQSLDPVTQHRQICQLSTGYEFPWATNRALEIALLRTFCVPSIAAILQQTGKFIHHSQNRYDDTGLLIANILHWGYDSPQGSAAIARMNQIHGRYRIHNTDYLYVLSTFIFEPIRWNQRFGWRPLCEQERLALFYFWRAVGERMHIQHIPTTYEAFEQFNQDFERQHLKYSEANRLVADAVLKMLLSWFPALGQPLVRSSVYALLDDTMLAALNWPQPTPRSRQFVTSALKLRQQALRWLPPRKSSGFKPAPMMEGHLAPAETLDQATSAPFPPRSRCPFHQILQLSR